MGRELTTLLKFTAIRSRRGSVIIARELQPAHCNGCAVEAIQAQRANCKNKGVNYGNIKYIVRAYGRKDRPGTQECRVLQVVRVNDQ